MPLLPSMVHKESTIVEHLTVYKFEDSDFTDIFITIAKLRYLSLEYMFLNRMLKVYNLKFGYLYFFH